MAIILDGKALSRKIEAELKERIESNPRSIVRPPKLAVVTVGDDPASQVYVRNKKRACERVGITFEQHLIPSSALTTEVYRVIHSLNGDNKVDGIILQLPTGLGGPCDKFLQHTIARDKDVDGFKESSRFKPCTPKGIVRLLDEYKVPIEGANAVVIGRSDIVGRPLARMLTDRDATVTLCHSKTKQLYEHCWKANIIVSAAGVPNLVNRFFVQHGCTIVDVGINWHDGKMCGDVDFNDVETEAAYITPVPGGVGPMTVAMLMENTVLAWEGR